MSIPASVIEAIGPDAFDQIAACLGGDGLHDSRQGRIHESRRFDQGSRGSVHHRRCSQAWDLETRRPDCRGHGRQYGNRPGARRQCARLQDRHRDSEYAKPGKEGHAALAGRRTDRSPGRALFESQQLCQSLRPARRTSCPGITRKARSGPISSTMSPIGRAISTPTGAEIWDDTQGKIDGFTCAVGTGGTLGRHRHGPQSQKPCPSKSLSPIRWARLSTPITPPAC